VVLDNNARGAILVVLRILVIPAETGPC